MLEMMLGLYLKSLGIAVLIVGVSNGLWLLGRLIGRVDKTPQERRAALYETVLIGVMTVPVLSFGIVALLIIGKV